MSKLITPHSGQLITTLYLSKGVIDLNTKVKLLEVLKKIFYHLWNPDLKVNGLNQDLTGHAGLLTTRRLSI